MFCLPEDGFNRFKLPPNLSFVWYIICIEYDKILLKTTFLFLLFHLRITLWIIIVLIFALKYSPNYVSIFTLLYTSIFVHNSRCAHCTHRLRVFIEYPTYIDIFLIPFCSLKCQRYTSSDIHIIFILICSWRLVE